MSAETKVKYELWTAYGVRVAENVTKTLTFRTAKGAGTDLLEQRRVDLYDGADVASIIDRLTTAAQGLKEARLEVTLDTDSFGAPVATYAVEGWRPATVAEVEAAQEAQKREEERRKAHARQQLASLQAQADRGEI